MKLFPKLGGRELHACEYSYSLKRSDCREESATISFSPQGKNYRVYGYHNFSYLADARALTFGLHWNQDCGSFDDGGAL